MGNYINMSFDDLDLQHYSSKYDKIVFHIDLPGVSRGYYTLNTIMPDIKKASIGVLSTSLYKNLATVLDYLEMQATVPCKFVINYDINGSAYNKSIDPRYKSNRVNQSLTDLSDYQVDLMIAMKKQTFLGLHRFFNIPGKCSVVGLRGYEADIVPDIIIGQMDEPRTLSIIIAIDKDLTQTCRYDNTIMYRSMMRHKSTMRKNPALSLWVNTIIDNDNAMEFVSESVKGAGLTSNYIPHLLSLSGDSADSVPNICKGIGKSTAVKLIHQNISMYGLPDQIEDDTQLIPIISDHIDRFKLSMNLTSFHVQKQCMPISVLNDVLLGAKFVGLNVTDFQ